MGGLVRACWPISFPRGWKVAPTCSGASSRDLAFLNPSAPEHSRTHHPMSILEPIIPWAFLNPIAHQEEGTDAKKKKCPEYLGKIFPCITICTLKGRSSSCIQILHSRDICSIHHSSCSPHWITIRWSGVLFYIAKHKNDNQSQSAMILRFTVVSWFKTV